MNFVMNHVTDAFFLGDLLLVSILLKKIVSSLAAEFGEWVRESISLSTNEVCHISQRGSTANYNHRTISGDCLRPPIITPGNAVKWRVPGKHGR